jgi:hypothetical protein
MTLTGMPVSVLVISPSAATLRLSGRAVSPVLLPGTGTLALAGKAISPTVIPETGTLAVAGEPVTVDGVSTVIIPGPATLSLRGEPISPTVIPDKGVLALDGRSIGSVIIPEKGTIAISGKAVGPTIIPGEGTLSIAGEQPTIFGASTVVTPAPATLSLRGESISPTVIPGKGTLSITGELISLDDGSPIGLLLALTKTTAAPAWSPLDVSPYVFIDGGDSTSLWTDAGRTTQAAYGDGVYVADDLAHVGSNYLVQATSGSRPKCETGYLEFTGINSQSMKLDSTMSASIPYEYYIAARFHTDDVLQYFTDSLEGTTRRALYADTGGIVLKWTDVMNEVGADAIADNSRHVVRCLVTSTSHSIQVDGGTVYTSTRANSVVPTRPVIGARYNQSVGFAHMELYAWLVTPELSSSDRDLLTAWLSAKIA